MIDYDKELCERLKPYRRKVQLTWLPIVVIGFVVAITCLSLLPAEAYWTGVIGVLATLATALGSMVFAMHTSRLTIWRLHGIPPERYESNGKICVVTRRCCSLMYWDVILSGHASGEDCDLADDEEFVFRRGISWEDALFVCSVLYQTQRNAQDGILDGISLDDDSVKCVHRVRLRPSEESFFEQKAEMELC